MKDQGTSPTPKKLIVMRKIRYNKNSRDEQIQHNDEYIAHESILENSQGNVFANYLKSNNYFNLNKSQANNNNEEAKIYK